MSKEIVPVAEKYLLTINEAASYFTLVQRKYVMLRLLMQSCS